MSCLQYYSSRETSFSGGKLSALPFEELNCLLLKTLIEQKIEHLKL